LVISFQLVFIFNLRDLEFVELLFLEVSLLEVVGESAYNKTLVHGFFNDFLLSFGFAFLFTDFLLVAQKVAQLADEHHDQCFVTQRLSPVLFPVQFVH